MPLRQNPRLGRFTKMIKRPNSRVNLDKAIERLFGSYAQSTEARSVMAGAIVGQMLKCGVVKGGCGLKLRYGMRCTRATMDLDAACKGDVADFIGDLDARLRVGWCGFTGEIAGRNPATPKNVPAQYVMRPYAVHLMYGGQSWCTRRTMHGDISKGRLGVSSRLSARI